MQASEITKAQSASELRRGFFSARSANANRQSATNNGSLHAMTQMPFKNTNEKQIPAIAKCLQ